MGFLLSTREYLLGCTKSVARKREQKKRWFRNGQKWRTGCEGRISVAKRRHGLDRCHYKGSNGMKRWVGLGVDPMSAGGRRDAEVTDNQAIVG